MHRINFLVLFSLTSLGLFSQYKNCDKSAIDKTYTYSSIYGGIKSLVDKPAKDNYFNDTFFNDLLAKIVQDKKLSDKEKVQIFYLMQKKTGFAFSGVSYLPPEQNYFINHQGKVYTYQKTQASLKSINYNPSAFLKIAETYRTSDAILASNALFLATLLNADSAVKRLHHFTKDNVIREAKNPNIFNHYVCLSASLCQDSTIVKNLTKNLESFSSNEWKEDVLSALYAKSNPLSIIKQYLLQEKNEKNGLAIQTGLCILSERVPEASFQASLEGLKKNLPEKWKKDIVSNVLDKKYPYNYSLSSQKKVVTKVWEGITVHNCPDGIIITNGALTEFDEN